MHINIQSRHFSLTPALNEHVQSKIRLTLGRFEHKIMRIDVNLSDVNGPKGGEDKCCKIIVKPNNSAAIVVADTAIDMYDAINSCSKRVKRTIRRNFNFPVWQREKLRPLVSIQE